MGMALDQDKEKQIPPSLSPLARLRTGRNDKNNPEKSKFWAAGWATAGALVWASVAVLARVGVARIGVIELVFLFAPLVIVPLGMEVGRVSGTALSPVSRRLGEWAQVLQPLGAALAVFAMLLPPGTWAGVAASGWLVVCGAAAAGGMVELKQLFLRSPENHERTGESPVPTRVAEVALSIARVDLVVGGAWLVASRIGMRPMGIQEPIGLLTAVHFHFAGFATAMIASCRASLDRTLRNSGPAAEGGCPHMSGTGNGTWLRWVVLLVVGMPFLVAVGFVTSPALKMVAGVLFAASVAGLALFVWNSHVEDGRARGLLRAAAGAVFAGVVLAGVYAVADFVGSEALTIPRMASTHGILNGFGFCLLGLLGWLVEWEGRDDRTLGSTGGG
ncbi:MAG: hypothetical protein DMG77_17745 [Acidobacteria bacterium]|nr:MAG: hypothetical protein DMG77_17745 [Acidobacteriota bacterium]